MHEIMHALGAYHEHQRYDLVRERPDKPSRDGMGGGASTQRDARGFPSCLDVLLA